MVMAATKFPVVHWVPDKQAPNCQACAKAFTLFFRRHHCRACGHVFCDNCTRGRMKLPRLNIKEEVRVCSSCFVAERPPSQVRLPGAAADDPVATPQPPGEGETAATATKRLCDACKKPCQAVRYCSLCKDAYYCTRTCQEEHWRYHEPICIVKRRRVSTATSSSQSPAPPGGPKF